MIDILINIIFVLGLIIAGAFGAWKVYNFTIRRYQYENHLC